MIYLEHTPCDCCPTFKVWDETPDYSSPWRVVYDEYGDPQMVKIKEGLRDSYSHS